MDGFALIADPTRRTILERLRAGASDVTGLVEALRIPQPLVSKHLRALRDAGAVVPTVTGRRRVYRLAADPLPEVIGWVAPYHRAWAASLDRLASQLDEEEER